MTSRRQISLFGEDEWTSLQEDSHAKTQVRQNNSGKDSSGLGVSERDREGVHGDKQRLAKAGGL